MSFPTPAAARSTTATPTGETLSLSETLLARVNADLRELVDASRPAVRTPIRERLSTGVRRTQLATRRNARAAQNAAAAALTAFSAAVMHEVKFIIG